MSSNLKWLIIQMFIILQFNSAFFKCSTSSSLAVIGVNVLWTMLGILVYPHRLGLILTGEIWQVLCGICHWWTTVLGTQTEWSQKSGMVWFANLVPFTTGTENNWVLYCTEPYRLVETRFISQWTYVAVALRYLMRDVFLVSGSSKITEPSVRMRAVTQ